MSGTLTARSPKGFRQSRLKRIAQAVAVAIGISLFMPVAHAPALSLSAKEFAYAILNNKTQYKCLTTLWGKESAWDHKAISYDGSAYGIPQLRNKKIYYKDPNTQVVWGLRYIKHRYQTPCAALRHWRVKGNY